MFKLHVYFCTKNNERFTFDNVWILMLGIPIQPHIRHIEFPTNTTTFAFSIWITGFKIYYIQYININNPAFNLKYNFLLLHISPISISDQNYTKIIHLLINISKYSSVESTFWTCDQGLRFCFLVSLVRPRRSETFSSKVWLISWSNKFLR